ncbi:hypothetical protein M514_04101 [Trichuris suis]|uniref:Uncharacterized protein n=1 Tax=Trichuris suis TaxID=68888 RepID=A0A085MCH3_9BILA|nr:hypothetical protein M513_04101 [Trichuris suis]KFD68398.1 hypothetical protein M514_04101 [Trichuris suis]
MLECTVCQLWLTFIADPSSGRLWMRRRTFRLCVDRVSLTRILKAELTQNGTESVKLRTATLPLLNRMRQSVGVELLASKQYPFSIPLRPLYSPDLVFCAITCFVHSKRPYEDIDQPQTDNWKRRSTGKFASKGIKEFVVHTNFWRESYRILSTFDCTKKGHRLRQTKKYGKVMCSEGLKKLV